MINSINFDGNTTCTLKKNKTKFVYSINYFKHHPFHFLNLHNMYLPSRWCAILRANSPWGLAVMQTAKKKEKESDAESERE